MPPLVRGRADFHTGADRVLERVRRTRNRIPQSCQECRRRKLKCDRQHPTCENCLKRGDADSCIYVEPPEDEKTRALRARLEQLEAQVHEISQSLAAAEKTGQKEEEDPEVDLVQQFDKLRVRSKDDKAVYYGPNSRHAIMTEFSDIIKMHKRKETCEIMTSMDLLLEDNANSIQLAFPFSTLPSMDDLQALLPNKSLCDILLNRYYECSNSLFPVLGMNMGSWEQYDDLWSKTSPTPVSLLAIAFFAISIAARSLNPNHEILDLISPDGQIGALKMSRRWKSYGQLALSQNDMLRKSSLRNIQALLLLCILEEVDAVRWNLLGMLGNMSRIVGLHRDPNVFREQLDEKGRKTRRRLWLCIYILDQIESTRYGYPPSISEDSFDCEAHETPAEESPNPENTFLFWMFKIHRTFAQSFPGPLGLHKTLSGVDKSDQRIQALLREIPYELSMPKDYIAGITDSPTELIRRYAIACMIQGHLLTLHRPYAAKSPVSRNAATAAAWALVSYQAQIISLSSTLEPFLWYIEEFVDPHLFRATAMLGAMLSRDPNNPLFTTILDQIELCANQAKAKSLRKRDFAKTFGVLSGIHAALQEKEASVLVDTVIGPASNPPIDPFGDGDDWVMEEVLSEPMFRWDDYLVDAVLNTEQNTFDHKLDGDA